MCGRIRKGTRVFEIKSGLYLPREIILATNGKKVFHASQDIKISDHRFIRTEKLDWWRHKLGEWKGIIRAQIDCDEFEESSELRDRTEWFKSSDGSAISGFIHRPIWSGGPPWVISLLTTHAEGKVLQVHHRMPVMEARWAA